MYPIDDEAICTRRDKVMKLRMAAPHSEARRLAETMSSDDVPALLHAVATATKDQRDDRPNQDVPALLHAIAAAAEDLREEGYGRAVLDELTRRTWSNLGMTPSRTSGCQCRTGCER
jgi:predicted HD phosphohydrolase